MTLEGLMDHVLHDGGQMIRGGLEVCREIVPENPLMPVMVIVEFADVPAGIANKLGLADIVKSEGIGLVKLASRISSGAIPPGILGLVIVTQRVSLLVPEQPVGKRMKVPVVERVILYSMKNRRPVVGAIVTPPCCTAATRTSPFVEFMLLATTRTFCNTVPPRLSFRGRSIVGSVKTWISKPFSADEFWTFIPICSMPPTFPCNMAGREGQVLEVERATQTVPFRGVVVTVNNTTVECDRLPPLPVTLTPNVPVGPPTKEAKVKAAEPAPPDGNETLVGLMLHWGHIGQASRGCVARLIVPLNPFKLVSEIDEVTLLPDRTF